MDEIKARIEKSHPENGSVEIFWFEQSHFLFKTERNQLIHIDPFLSRTVRPENHIYPEPLLEPGEATATHVFMTHDHRDHTDPETLKPLSDANTACEFIGSSESCETCKSIGIPDALLTQAVQGRTISFDGFSVDVVFAKDTSDENTTTHLGFVFDFNGISAYVTGDTRTNPEEYASELLGVAGSRPDVMIVPVNDGYNNPGPGGASKLVEMVDPGLIIPCHFGCFKNNTIDPNLFLEALNTPYRERAKIMKRGESIVLSA